MKKLQALVAGSSLALSAGYASAAYDVTDFTFDVDGQIYNQGGCPTCFINGSGTGQYNHETEEFTFEWTEDSTASVSGSTYEQTTVWEDGYVNTTPDPVLSSDTQATIVSCTDTGGAGAGNVICLSGGQQPGTTQELGDAVDPNTLQQVGITIDTTFGSSTTFELDNGNAFRDFILLAGETTTVPVPAAAWLFGSAILGLAGVTRRRRA